MQRPEQITNFEVDEIVSQCEAYLSSVEANKFDARERAYAQYEIFVSVMKAFYGPGVFEWVNSKRK